mmetsp:Transcript_35845/g.72784  ORF Transcript_35845/g.72784 Transcript_35845/m.72784 type:complete len:202 (-) Transcript_35845:1175-1780(-)
MARAMRAASASFSSWVNLAAIRSRSLRMTSCILASAWIATIAGWSESTNDSAASSMPLEKSAASSTSRTAEPLWLPLPPLLFPSPYTPPLSAAGVTAAAAPAAAAGGGGSGTTSTESPRLGIGTDIAIVIAVGGGLLLAAAAAEEEALAAVGNTSFFLLFLTLPLPPFLLFLFLFISSFCLVFLLVAAALRATAVLGEGGR